MTACGHAASRLRVFLLLVALLLFCPALAEDVHWGYNGDEGPEHWAELSPAFSICASGKEQSPIDLVGAKQVAGSEFERIGGGVVVDFEKRSTILDLLDNGHTIQVTPNARVGLDVEGEHFELRQFHFHAPSEHAIEGVRFPLEAHFVMSNSAAQLAVLGILYQEGEHDPEFGPIVSSLPQQPGEDRLLDNLDLDLESLKPLPESFYAYRGSLTTPPCSEGVRWFVIAEPESLSAEQLASFGAVLRNNARPLQSRYERELLRVDTSQKTSE